MSAHILPTALLTCNNSNVGIDVTLLSANNHQPNPLATIDPKCHLCHLILVTLGFRLRPPTPQGVILSLSNFWGTQKHEAKPSGISVGYAWDDVVEKCANKISIWSRDYIPIRRFLTKTHFFKNIFSKLFDIFRNK